MATPSGFHSLELIEIRPETVDARTLVFGIPEPLQPAFRAKPGQHVTLQLVLDGEEVRRSYSLTALDCPDRIAVTIKRVPGGLVSPHLHATAALGQFYDVSAPQGRFSVPPLMGKPRRHLAIVAGSGITPLIGMIEQVLAEDDASDFTLIYGNRTPERIIFRERLETLKNRHLDRLTLIHVLSRDAEADVPLLTGRIDGPRVGRLVAALLPPLAVDTYYLCGPGSLIKDSRDALMGLGVARERIKFEFFKSGPETPPRVRTPEPATAEVETGGADVTVVIDGARRSFRVPPGGHIVDAALAAGIAVPYSCKGGMCCTCRAKLIEGRVEMTRNFSLEPWEQEAGFVLACQSVPTTDRVVLNFDQM